MNYPSLIARQSWGGLPTPSGDASLENEFASTSLEMMLERGVKVDRTPIYILQI